MEALERATFSTLADVTYSLKDYIVRGNGPFFNAISRWESFFAGEPVQSWPSLMRNVIQPSGSLPLFFFRLFLPDHMNDTAAVVTVSN